MLTSSIQQINTLFYILSNKAYIILSCLSDIRKTFFRWFLTSVLLHVCFTRMYVLLPCRACLPARLFARPTTCTFDHPPAQTSGRLLDCLPTCMPDSPPARRSTCLPVSHTFSTFRSSFFLSALARMAAVLRSSLLPLMSNSSRHWFMATASAIIAPPSGPNPFHDRLHVFSLILSCNVGNCYSER